MTYLIRFAVAWAIFCFGYAVGAGTAHASPVPGPLYDNVCPYLDAGDSVMSIRRLMNSYTNLLFSQQNAWDTIVNAMADGCPQHADQLREYARVWGNTWDRR